MSQRPDVRARNRLLDGEASAELRARLVAEINALERTDDATGWAQRRMADKNSLSPADARKVEEAFQAELMSLAVSTSEGAPQRNGSRKSVRPRRTLTIDKSALTLPEPRRARDREHVRLVAQKACLICGRHPSDSHHIRFAQSRAMGRKVSDEFTVPLCRGHHRELHRFGDETAWWQRQGIDPTPVARALWLESHPLPEVEISTATATNHPTVTDRTLP
jgi:hypothetical protein